MNFKLRFKFVPGLGLGSKQHADTEQAFYEFEQSRLKRTNWITKTSRQIGQLAQLENRFLISIRNKALRILPASLHRMQMRKLMNVSFSYPDK